MDVPRIPEDAEAHRGLPTDATFLRLRLRTASQARNSTKVRELSTSRRVSNCPTTVLKRRPNLSAQVTVTNLLTPSPIFFQRSSHPPSPLQRSPQQRATSLPEGQTVSQRSQRGIETISIAHMVSPETRERRNGTRFSHTQENSRISRKRRKMGREPR